MLDIYSASYASLSAAELFVLSKKRYNITMPRKRKENLKMLRAGRMPRRPSLFWDVDPETIDPKKHSRYVIERILERGDERDIKWLFENFKNSEIKKTLVKIRNISPRSANYWSLILGIPKEKILCFRARSQRKPQKTWPY